jgi:hypothetical protein
MNKIEAAAQRYAASAALERDGAELVAVGDPVGARLNRAVRQIRLAVRDDGPELWEDLMRPAVALRWRLITQPQPLAYNPGLGEAATAVIEAASRMRSGVGPQAGVLLDAIADAARELAASDPAVGGVLLQSIEEVGAEQCIVFAARPRAAAGLAEWLAELGVAIVTVGGVRQQTVFAAQGYAAGPPVAFNPSVVTAPTVTSLSFLFPAWIADRSIPRSAIAKFAEGALEIRSRLFEEGGGPQMPEPPAEAAEDQLIPQLIWSTAHVPMRRPQSDEVLAHRVLLSGGLAIYLDTEEGDRIRSFDPRLPPGERVIQTEITAIREGSYLVLREGQSEVRALYDHAILLLGARAVEAEASQRQWKERLQQRLDRLGRAAVVRALEQAGVRRAGRAARTWTVPTVTRPQADADFERLLQWLDLPVHPAFELATELRRLRFQVGQDVRQQLEDALAAADLTQLEREGHLRIDIPSPGFRGMVATRVLAISPTPEVIPRSDARVPSPDQGAQWHE